MKCIFQLAAVMAGIFFSTAQAKTFDDMFPQYSADFTTEERKLVGGFDYQQGAVKIGDGLALMTVPAGFYFLGPKDAAKVLTSLWGNVPDEATLGMLFPANITPLHNGWAMEVSFEDIGYVSDEDAEDYDYNSLLDTMRADTEEESEWRQQNGYGPIRLIGWAEAPYYDKGARQLYWAKELQFGNDAVNTLNFNIRNLGRRGVMVQNFIASMDQLIEVKAVLPVVLAMTEFTDGNTYADFDPSLDTVAAVGIGGLIAGKVVAKTGLLIGLLLILKKAWFLLLLPLIWLKKVISRRKNS